MNEAYLFAAFMHVGEVVSTKIIRNKQTVRVQIPDPPPPGVCEDSEADSPYSAADTAKATHKAMTRWLPPPIAFGATAGPAGGLWLR